MSVLADVLTLPLDEVSKREWDALVVGSGTAGVTTALALAAHGWKVAILEAGPLVVTQHVGSSPLRSRSALVGELQARVSYPTRWAEEEIPQWSLAGGRTVLWGGCTPRFHPPDFATWPFDYAEFEPYYAEAERLISVSGSPGTLPAFCQGPEHERILGLLREHGIPAGYAPLAVDTRPAVAGHIPRGFDSSIARLIESPYFRNGVELVVEAPVTALHAQGQLIRSLTAGGLELACKRVVLAAGALASTNLALRSGLDSEHIGHWVGDHLLVGGALQLPEAPPERPLYLLIDPEPERPFQVQLEGPFARLDMHPYHTTSWLDLPPDGRTLLAVCFGIASAERENRLELGDPYTVHYARSDHDRRVLAQIPPFLERLAGILGARFKGSFEVPPGKALHEFGGLRMGSDPATSVVDAWGRFHGLENLWAADAATFPLQGAANSYLTITAWALRCAAGIATPPDPRPAPVPR